MSLWRWITKLHRLVGLFSAIILLMLAITGIALNHTETLKLDSKFIHSTPILDWYGIQVPTTSLNFSSSKYYISQLNNELYFQNKFLKHSSEKLIGLVETANYLAIGLEDSLLLITFTGEIIEQISMPNLSNIGYNSQQQIVLQQAQAVLFSSDDLLTWQLQTMNSQVKWSLATPLSAAQQQLLLQNFRNRILPLERFILDLHSGRLFGNFGVIIVDLSGIALILLTLSGCSVWIRQKLKRNQYRKK